MLFLSFVATCRASDICQGANVISCVTLVNLVWIILVIALHILEGRRKKNPQNLHVGYDTGKEKKSHYWFEERNKPPSWDVIPLWKSVKIDSRDMKHLCFNFWSVPLVSHRHTCGPAWRGVGKLWALIIFSPIFSWNASLRRYVLSGRLPGSHINVWNPFLRYELQIYAVSLPRFPTVAHRSSPQRPHAKRLWKIKHSGVGMGLLLLVCSHL